MKIENVTLRLPTVCRNVLELLGELPFDVGFSACLCVLKETGVRN